MKRQSPEDEFNAEIKKQRLSRVNPPVWTTSHGMSMMPIMHTPTKDSKFGTSPELKTKKSPETTKPTRWYTPHKHSKPNELQLVTVETKSESQSAHYLRNTCNCRCCRHAKASLCSHSVFLRRKNNINCSLRVFLRYR